MGRPSYMIVTWSLTHESALQMWYDNNSVQLAIIWTQQCKSLTTNDIKYLLPLEDFFTFCFCCILSLKYRGRCGRCTYVTIKSSSLFKFFVDLGAVWIALNFVASAFFFTRFAEQGDKQHCSGIVAYCNNTVAVLNTVYETHSHFIH